MQTRPWQVWVVTVMTAAVAIALFWIDHIPVRFLPVYAPGCALLVYAYFVGARWAFVLNVLTAWIFPYETAVGIKSPVVGSILTVTHFVSLGLLLSSWRYYWKRTVVDPMPDTKSAD